MKSKHLYTLLTLAVTAAVGFGSAAGLARNRGPDPIAGVERATPDESLGSHEIHQILGGSRRNRLQLSSPQHGELDASAPILFTVGNLFEAQALVRYAVELVDEFGAELITPYRSSIETIDAARAATFQLTDHRSLGEGLYLYRVTVVGRSGQAEADNTLHIPFAVLDGTLLPLNDEEWLVYSIVNGAQQ